ncbi:hypothetical protein Tco_0764597 [Tanacetum coccineum]
MRGEGRGVKEKQHVSSDDLAKEHDRVIEVSVRAFIEFFANSTYGFFLGKRVAYLVVKNYVKNTWRKYGLVKSMMNSFNGLFFFKFSSKDGLDAMLENGHCEDGLSATTTKLSTLLMLDSTASTMCMKSWDRQKRMSAKVTQDGKLGIPPPPQLTTFELPSAEKKSDKKRKRRTELIHKLVYDELIYEVESMPDFVQAKEIVEKNLDGNGTGSGNESRNGGNGDGDLENVGQTCPNSASDVGVAYPLISTPNPGKSSSYANVTAKPNRTKVNFHTLFTPVGNEIDVVVPVKLHGVPVTAFSEDGLSAIATKLSTSLMFDSYTSDMCMQSWGRSSYARAMIELRANVELKDNIVVVMSKITGEGFYTCNIRVEYE